MAITEASAGVGRCGTAVSLDASLRGGWTIAGDGHRRDLMDEQASTDKAVRDLRQAAARQGFSVDEPAAPEPRFELRAGIVVIHTATGGTRREAAEAALRWLGQHPTVRSRAPGR
jgi:hypothetical protein